MTAKNKNIDTDVGTTNCNHNNYNRDELYSQNQIYLKKLSTGQRLNNNEIRTVMTNIINGRCSDVFISAFLMSLILKGEDLEELKCVIEIIRGSSIPINPVSDLPIIDNCGTGGDFLNTFNISTTSAVIASSCKKIAIAKHGNKSSSSLSGSADLFEHVGYRLDDDDISSIVKSIENYGLGFLYAPRFHPGLRYVSKVRKELGIRTIFNKVGPLCNPCRNLYGQVIGVSDPSLLTLIPGIIPILGLQRAMIVRSHDGMDELSTTSRNTVIHITFQDGKYSVRNELLDPVSLGLPKSSIEEIIVSDRTESINESLRIIYGIQSNKSKENIVLLNSAAALMVGGNLESLSDAISIARDSLNEGRPQKLLENIIKNSGDVSKLEQAEKMLNIGRKN
ncbi:anthranilate phosphoribosyltransferase [Candidatus Nitrosocosmicus arcticus]|uniref:Anthranilate phosphoribosyltransferase n=1 Tax=Candidatus Nitrosocosmicus arcticus TaxID=2035267 RepID=A0A557SSE7_9ARCH|nr:anthranilate phosphoribosyltransferase [Candidatus Nitrosocosmicus arcticus]TVP39531.1 anthranilate phosphoribosyltransferase [Candidatus Nitrosocosmicus arcticus]